MQILTTSRLYSSNKIKKAKSLGKLVQNKGNTLCNQIELEGLFLETDFTEHFWSHFPIVCKLKALNIYIVAYFA